MIRARMRRPRRSVSCCSAVYAVARWSLDGFRPLALFIPLPAVAPDANRAVVGGAVFSASSLQCERRDGRSEPPMTGCMHVPCPCTVSRCSVERDGGPRFDVPRRSVDGLSANSFTFLRSAAAHQIAAFARECEQMKLEIRPLITLRTNAGCCRPFLRGSAQGCGGL